MGLEHGPTMERRDLADVSREGLERQARRSMDIRTMNYVNSSNELCLIVCHPEHHPVMLVARGTGWELETIRPEPRDMSFLYEKGPEVKVMTDFDADAARAAEVNKEKMRERLVEAKEEEDYQGILDSGGLVMPEDELDRLREQSMKELDRLSVRVIAEPGEQTAPEPDDEGPVLMKRVIVPPGSMMSLEEVLWDIRHAAGNVPLQLDISTIPSAAPDVDEDADEEEQRVQYLSDSDST